MRGVFAIASQRETAIHFCDRNSIFNMRNLKLLKSLFCSTAQGVGTPQCISIRSDAGTVLIGSGYGFVELDPNKEQIIADVSLTTKNFLPEDGSGHVVGIQDVPDQDSVCIATASGDVILCNLHTGTLECVGSVDSGIVTMSWSPDQELVLLVTGKHTLILMTKDFGPIAEVPIHQVDFGEGKFITVGWGQKKTQFHGSVGKKAAQQKMTTVKPALPWDDHKPRVTWRGDGQLFAVNAICPQTGSRKIRVWNRELSLQTTSESVDGLEQPISWKPSGSLIASTQSKPHKHDVIFFEKNGLVHGEFTLPFEKGHVQVKELLWNSESTVLAVWLQDIEKVGSKSNTYVHLWVVGNYHWYLKQTLYFGNEENRRLVSIAWDPESSYRLHVVCADWQYLCYEWSWSTVRSSGQGQREQADVAVIDGDKVLMTCFAQSVVPPPMCTFHVQFQHLLNEVVFCTDPEKASDFAVLDADNTVYIFRYGIDDDKDSKIKIALGNGYKTSYRTPALEKEFRLKVPSGNREPLYYHHLTLMQDDTLLIVSQGKELSLSTVYYIAPTTVDVSAVEPQHGMTINGHVVSICCSTKNKLCALQTENGDIWKYIWEQPTPVLEPWEDSMGNDVRFQQTCIQTALITIDGEEYEIAVGI